MNCKSPFIKSDLAFGCGQCMPCRIARRRLWTHRIMLEAYKHEKSSFVTLTYNPEKLPENGTLQPKDTQDWLKRLRKVIAPKKLRYFLVGEYGDETWRPHYHLALFGLGREDEELVRMTWGRGHVDVGDLTLASAQYVAGYVTKKMTSHLDPRIEFIKQTKGVDLHPEFARMSLRPGIGAHAMENVADAYTRSGVCNPDVPNVIQHGSKKYPLGRYLRGKLREKVGDKETMQKEAFQEYCKTMQEMFRSYRENPKKFSETQKQKIANIENKARVWSKKGSL